MFEVDLQVSRPFLELRLKKYHFSDEDIRFASDYVPRSRIPSAPIFVRTFQLAELGNSPVISMTGFPMNVVAKEVKVVLTVLPGYTASAFTHTHDTLVAYAWWDSLESARNARKVIRYLQMDPACAAAVKVSEPCVWDDHVKIPAPVISA